MSSKMERECKESPGYKNLRKDSEIGMLEVFEEEVQKCVSS